MVYPFSSKTNWEQIKKEEILESLTNLGMIGKIYQNMRVEYYLKRN